MCDHPSGWTATITLALTLATAAAAEVPPVFERHADGAGFTFQNAPRPAVDDAAARAEFRLLDGELDGNAGALDVVDADAPPPTAVPGGGGPRIVRSFEADGGRYRFTVDATAAPDLVPWVEAKLEPVVQQWYPKLVGMLPSPGYQARTNLTLRFRDDLGGTPASAGGARVNLNRAWFRQELEGEALGAVVHELVHAVQDYDPARYDASYRISGNFLDWITRTYDAEIVGELNAAAREGRYAEALWKERTGRTLPELGTEWRDARAGRRLRRTAPGHAVLDHSGELDAVSRRSRGSRHRRRLRRGGPRQRDGGGGGGRPPPAPRVPRRLEGRPARDSREVGGGEAVESEFDARERLILAHGGEAISVDGGPGYRILLQAPALTEPLPRPNP